MAERSFVGVVMEDRLAVCWKVPVKVVMGVETKKEEDEDQSWEEVACHLVAGRDPA